jgi:NAD(P)-dependent dehydrogenase (short-subunit alcohol dehydrogenase family)
LSVEPATDKIDIMKKEFDGKVALVTGGGSGIGRATAVAFAREGAKVVIGNRNAERGEETVSMIRDAGGTASFKRTDVVVAAEIEALVDHAVKTYGQLDVAFNNAGIEGDVKPTLVDQTEANYDAVMNVNVKGVWLSMKYEIPAMLKTGGGAIVNCSSVAGVIGFPGIGIYIASKHAVIGLTKTAALEFSAKGIRVNAVNPAVIDTEMVDRLADGMNMKKDDLNALHPIGRLGRVEEVAEAVLWLCSGKSSFVTGHSLIVDGGFTAQ